jgi:hypothetical protein
VLQAMLGLAAKDEPARKGPGVSPEHRAFVQQRIGELRARLAEGGASQATVRALLYVGMGGSGVDERAFNELREIRSENSGVTLQEFKRIVREQYFSLMLDREGALAAIPKMLPPDAATRRLLLEAIRRVADAAEPVTGEKAQRLAQVERLFAGGKAAEKVAAIEPAPLVVAKPAVPAKTGRVRASAKK